MKRNEYHMRLVANLNPSVLADTLSVSRGIHIERMAYLVENPFLKNLGGISFIIQGKDENIHVVRGHAFGLPCSAITSGSALALTDFKEFIVIVDVYWMGNHNAFNTAYRKLGLDRANWPESIYLDLLRKSAGDEEFDGQDLIGNTKHLMNAVNLLPELTKIQADLFFPPVFADNFPVAMQISHKYGWIYVYDLEIASAVYRNRISPDPIFFTAKASAIGGSYDINRQGQASLATVNEAAIVLFVSKNFPGAQCFQELFV